MNYNSAFTGAEIDALLSTAKVTIIESGTDLNSITERGFYQIPNGTVFQTLSNTPLDAVPAASLLIVIPAMLTGANCVQILIGNQNSSIFIRNSNTYGWDVVLRRSTARLKTGTIEQRPTVPSNQNKWYIGDIYFDTTLGKPIWWSGDTSDDKSGWVDATGATV